MSIAGEEDQDDTVVAESLGRSFIRSTIPDMIEEVRKLEEKYGYVRPATTTMSDIGLAERDYRHFLESK